jgi:hypothetical protein
MRFFIKGAIEKIEHKPDGTPYERVYKNEHTFDAASKSKALIYVLSMQKVHDILFRMTTYSQKDWDSAPMYIECVYEETEDGTIQKINF